MTRLILVALAAAICIILFSSMAKADDLRGNRSNCEQVGTLIVQAGEMRDSGVPWDVAQARLKELITESRKQPSSFVTTQAEADFVVAGVRKLWSSKDDPAFVVASEVFKDCMAGARKVKATI